MFTIVTIVLCLLFGLPMLIGGLYMSGVASMDSGGSFGLELLAVYAWRFVCFVGGVLVLYAGWGIHALLHG